jgi:dihydrofolate reductase
VIGAAGGMPWHLRADLQRFKRITIGKPVIMGRKTFESIGKPLMGRHNIVITRDPTWQAEGVTRASNLAEAIAAAGLHPDTRAEQIMVIGGGEIYAQSLALATRIELTEIHATPQGDTYFPKLNSDQWQEVAREAHAPEGDTPAYSFVTLVRKD